jgi:catechol 2,3-dioxygenase-like lactoylglutathione lyase family enzyme
MNDEQISPESKATPGIGSVLETSLYVADVDRSNAFYQRVLGFPPASEPMSRMCALRITVSQVLLLFKKGGSVQATVTPCGIIPPTDGDGSLHVTFFIPGPTFEIWQERLRRSEVQIESILTWPTGAAASTSGIRTITS